MLLDDLLQNVSIIGAAGKMGSGIALLLLQEIASTEARLTAGLGRGRFHLQLIDVNEQAFYDLRHYLKTHLMRYAERNIIALRKYFANEAKLVSNQDIIEDFVEGALECIRFETNIEKAADSFLIFEAVVEDVEVKANLLKKIHLLAKKAPYYFSNTSSIPISILEEKSRIQHRILGFHFYNPPAVQRLIEVIIPEKTNPELKDIANELVKRLHKIMVYSKDVAGFIGNGHFIREIAFANEKVQELKNHHAIHEAIFMINKVTQDFLVRPMGIFQLIDYVGVDVCQKITSIMECFLPNAISFQKDLVDQAVKVGLLGGQYADGTQKDGFFHYENNEPTALYSFAERRYISFSDGNWIEKCHKNLGVLPEEWLPWKKLSKDPLKHEKIQKYFQKLLAENILGAKLSQEFLNHSLFIARNLVADGVAQKMEDVATVLENGFYHLYGPEDILQESVRSLL